MPGGQTEMVENLRNHGGVFDSGNNLEFAATVGAMFHIDIEHPFTKAFHGFRPSGRHAPFKARSRRFCE
jgi:hypothetical protein